MTTLQNRAIPEEIKAALDEWDRTAARLLRLYAMLGALSVVCSLFVATFTGSDAVLAGSIRLLHLSGPPRWLGLASSTWGQKQTPRAVLGEY
jgi:hypothetical protein